ncbi:gliding motility-associated ABC transporter ATP-binding subunit GldA [Mangrovibacterium marinum]|uniref:Protein involved in gliding motility GldA n=1 Tax=Mangrovibacterium marinum TaxID=1639118 RepID=A0A2T5C2R0_9BACT|nr:gliding motility-associated ABC transporter ATP-binding subunit GldA [Mangrovibacterium marinum]PTN09006.1 protein involved in gliding motility GldA [Mangrovibacterium marinum]
MTIQIENISKYYGKQKAVDSLHIELNSGELIGFLGPNGAGKSTLMKIITGFLAPDEGRVLINGQEVAPANKHIRRQIGYLPEHNPLYTDLYIKEYLQLTAGMYGLPNKKQQADRVIEMTGLGAEQHKKIGALSKGYRQRVGLAQALIHDPSVLILDEPTTGLDPNQLDEIRSLIKTISREKTVLFSTHIMQEVEAICNRVIIINKGKLIADKPVNDLKSGKLFSTQQVLIEFAEPVAVEKLSSTLAPNTIEQLAANSFLIHAAGTGDVRPALFRFAVENNLTMLTMHEQQTSLESIFRKLTGN